MKLRALLVALLVALPGVARAGSPPTALGSQGRVYRVLEGTYGELFPGAPAASAANPVLALESVETGKKPVRRLVPGTEDSASEKFPALSVDPTTNDVFLVWEKRTWVYSTLHLTVASGDRWSKVFDLYGDGLSTKLNPQVATTTETYQVLESGGELASKTRTVLHLVWFDSGGYGERTLYVPLVFHDGAFLADWQVFSLADFLPPAESASAAAPQLVRAPSVRAARGGDGVVIAFADSLSGRLAVVESRPVTGSLVGFADEARHQVIDVGRTVTDRRAIVDKARHQVIDVGRRMLGRELGDVLAQRFLDAVGGSDPAESLASVVDKARHQVIDVGVRLGDPRPRAKVAASQVVLDMAHGVETADSSNLASFQLTFLAAAPWVPNREVRLLPSHAGEDLVLAWDLESALRYRQSEADGWSEVLSLALDADLTREQAYDILDRRLNRR